MKTHYLVHYVIIEERMENNKVKSINNEVDKRYWFSNSGPSIMVGNFFEKSRAVYS